MNLPTIEGSYEGITMYYSSDASGSIISPDHHVSESDGRLQRWIQWGDTNSGNGSMIFLDTQLQKVATLEMYRTNGLWYAQVGNSQTQIDTTELPSIRSVEYAASTPVPPPSLRDQLAGDNTNVINMVLQDTGPLLSHGTPVKNTTPQIHSNTA